MKPKTRVLAWLCADNWDPIDDEGIKKLLIDESIMDEDGYFELDWKKYVYYWDVKKDRLEKVQDIIDSFWYEKWMLSDGYHTFDELYEHRYRLFIALCNTINKTCHKVIKSKLHYDWSNYQWYFILQLYTAKWQISYHIPMRYRDNVFVDIQEKADERDWHTSNDVLERLLFL